MTRSLRAPLVRWILAASAVGALAPAAAAAQAPSRVGPTPKYVPDQVVVGYEPGTSGAERARTRRQAEARLKRRLLVPRTELLRVGAGESVAETIAELERRPDVAFAEPNFLYRLAAEPTDALYQAGDLWNLDLIGAPQAWESGNGDDDVVLAVVDSGVDLEHPDLADNIWSNQLEQEGGGGVDDDNNGFTDDLTGWDFVGGDPDPSDEEGHGTHVAGIAGAVGNNGGAVGVNWDVGLMPLRACNRVGSCPNALVADAFTYAAMNGAKVVNASISGSFHSQLQENAIAASRGTLFVVAAGNDGTDNDAVPRYPCNHPQANLVCVAATTQQDQLSSFSNFGGGPVDLAAPGGNLTQVGGVLSTYAMEPTDPMSENFASGTGPGPGGLGDDWETGGAPDTWKRTTEQSELPSPTTLTDSEGGNYQQGADNHASFGPVDLTDSAGCHLRYDLAIDVREDGDSFSVLLSSDGVAYTQIPDESFFGSAEVTRTPDIPALYEGGDVYVRFRLTSNLDNKVGDGVHLDNVRIRCRAHDYRVMSGTSMAAPHVSGAAALALDEAPGATVPELRSWLLDGVDLKDSLDGVVASGGRLNLARVIAAAHGEDIRRPDTSIVSGPSSPHRSGSATIGFASDEPGSTFECSLNGSAFAACGSPATLNGLAVGAHTFRVRAVDAAGNQDASPAQYSFTVETDPRVFQCAQLRKQVREVRKQFRKVKRARVAKPKAKRRLARKHRKLKSRIRRDCVPAGL